jgi:hypothetical protein
MYAIFVTKMIRLVQQRTSNITFTNIKGIAFLLVLAVRNKNGQTEWANLDRAHLTLHCIYYLFIRAFINLIYLLNYSFTNLFIHSQNSCI